MLFSIICPPIILQTFRFYFFATYSFTMSSNSTSNFNTLFGLISCPAPRSPVANSAGIQKIYLEPTGMICKPSVQPLITWPTPNSAARHDPRSYQT